MSPSAEQWSAVAAIASAVTAVVSVSWQRRSMQQSARPELIFDEISREEDAGTVTVRARVLRNVGTGSAHSIRCESDDESSPRRHPIYPVAGGHFIPLLEADARVEVAFEIITVAPKVVDGIALDLLASRLSCFDQFGYRHDVTFKYYISSEHIFLTQPVAPGVYLASRESIAISPMRQRLENHMFRLARRWRKVLIFFRVHLT